jgi:Zn-dependent membrane protease YugP
MALVPVTNIATQASMFLFFGGLILGFMKMALVAVAIYGVVAVFQLVTLPVEYDASRRAKKQLLSSGIVNDRESRAVASVLSAAALTYVAALVSAVVTLLYWLSILNRGNRG